MHKKHLVIVGIAFLMCAISLYFGVRIYNANANIHLTELNEHDNIHYDDVSLVPNLSFLAACITLPFILAIGTLEVISIFKTEQRQVKNVAIGLTVVALIVLVIDIMTISNPVYFDFSQWGFVWICFGLVFIAGNILSFGIYRFSKPQVQEEN